MDTVLPNKTPYRLQMFKKATIVFGKPIVFDELLAQLRQQNLDAVSSKNYNQEIINLDFINIKHNFLRPRQER
jgi:hypothetical protein